MKSLSICFLIALPAIAQTQADVAQCANLRKHGDPGSTACYQRLTRSSDPAVRAEGFWAQRNYQDANNAFRDALKAHDKDVNIRVRWGLMYLEHKGPMDAATAEGLFEEALGIDNNNARGLLAMGQYAAEGFEGSAAELTEKAVKADPKLYEAHELLARLAL